MKQNILCITFVSCVLGLAGCSSVLSVGSETYSCSGLPVGVRCMSAKDVYAATENADHLAPTDRKVQAAQPATRQSLAKIGPEPVPSIEKIIPIRTPAKVMRTRIFPWEDEANILHAREYLFTEIEERKWTVGAETISGVRGVGNPLHTNNKPKAPSSPLKAVAEQGKGKK